MEITKHTPGMFSWADLATPDPEGSKAFYTEFLGLTAIDLPMQPGMVYSMLAKDGSNVCAIYQMPEEMGQMTGGQPVWNSYFTVESADETASRVAELGGAVMMGPVDVFDSGRMVVSSDPTGAVFSVWEPKSHTGAQVFGEPGALAWNELKTHDTEAAAQFYGGLFGWSANTTPSAGGGEYTEFRLDGVSAAGMMAIRKEWGEVPPNWTVYFAVASLDAALDTANRLGATVAMAPMEVQGVGRFALLRDPQGAYVYVIQIARGA